MYLMTKWLMAIGAAAMIGSARSFRRRRRYSVGDSSVARPYDSQPCTSIVDPGIAVVRLGSRMSLAIETRTFDTPVIIGVSLNEFAIRRAGGARPSASEFIFSSGYRQGVSDHDEPAIGDRQRYPASDADGAHSRTPDRRGKINGYVVGTYSPCRTTGRLNRFVEITPDLMDLHLSRQFRIGDLYQIQDRWAAALFSKYAVIPFSIIQKVEAGASVDQSRISNAKAFRSSADIERPITTASCRKPHIILSCWVCRGHHRRFGEDGAFDM